MMCSKVGGQLTCQISAEHDRQREVGLVATEAVSKDLIGAVLNAHPDHGSNRVFLGRL